MSDQEVMASEEMTNRPIHTALHPKFRFCPVCGEWCDVDEHTECPPRWRVTDGFGVEYVFAQTANDAACKYAERRDRQLSENGRPQTVSDIVIVRVTDQDGNDQSFLVAGQLVPVYSAIQQPVVGGE